MPAYLEPSPIFSRSDKKTCGAVSFNASEWIAENTRGGTALSKQTQEAISNFTLMWNFFESTLCENNAKITAFERIASSSISIGLPVESEETLYECLSFWQLRYYDPNGFNNRFSRLLFRPNDRKQHVEAVLKGEIASRYGILVALMIIIYRVRNNLFHGLKSLSALNQQTDNLNNASRCLAAILESARTPLVH